MADLLNLDVTLICLSFLGATDCFSCKFVSRSFGAAARLAKPDAAEATPDVRSLQTTLAAAMVYRTVKTLSLVCMLPLYMCELYARVLGAHPSLIRALHVVEHPPPDDHNTVHRSPTTTSERPHAP